MLQKEKKTKIVGIIGIPLTLGKGPTLDRQNAMINLISLYGVGKGKFENRFN